MLKELLCCFRSSGSPTREPSQREQREIIGKAIEPTPSITREDSAVPNHQNPNLQNIPSITISVPHDPSIDNAVQENRDTQDHSDVPSLVAAPRPFGGALRSSTLLTRAGLDQDHSQENADAKPEAKAAAKAKARELQGHIHASLCNPANRKAGDLEDDAETFMDLVDLHKLLDLDELDALFKHTTWYKKTDLAPLQNSFSKIVATLLLCDCNSAEWDRFGNRFYFQRNPGCSTDFVRCDEQLPFDDEQLGMIFADEGPLRKSFRSRQVIFCPHKFEEDEVGLEDQYVKLDSSKRLPFVKKELILEGEREVYQVTLMRNGLRRRNTETQQLEKDANQDPQHCAIKVFRKLQPFKDERRAHIALRKVQKDAVKQRRAAVDLSHIVLNVCSFQHGNLWYTLYPWADIDLSRIFWGTLDDHDLLNQNRFEASAVLSELAGLMDGLAFLHSSELSIRHFDIKPENVLVYNLFPPYTMCGTWKLADFGLCRVRYLEPFDPRNPTATRELSSVTAPRQSGAFLPPEMRAGGRVSPLTDVFSMGAILMVARAFLLGGPLAYDNFRQARSSLYENDQFYLKADQEYKLKPEIVQWQNDCPIPSEHTETDWPKRLLQLAQELIVIERDRRLGAAAASRKLREIANGTRVSKQTWSFIIDSSMRTDANRTAEYSIGNAGLPHHSVNFPPASLRNPMYIMTNNSFRASCGRVSADWAAFMSGSKIQVYHFAQIASETSIWHSDEVRARSARLTFPEIVLEPASPRATFRNIGMSGDWLACTVREEDDVSSSHIWAELHQLSYDTDGNVRSMHLLREDIPCDAGDFLDVIVSPQGLMAIVCTLKIAFFSPTGFVKTIEFPSCLAASFSRTGKYICVCLRNNERLCWKMYRCKTSDGSIEQLQDFFRYAPLPSCHSKSMTIWPSAKGLQFFAFTPKGRYWSIAYGAQSETEELPEHELDGGQVQTVSPHAKNAVTVVRRENGGNALYVSGLTRLGALENDRKAGVMVNERWLSWKSMSAGEVIDVQLLIMPSFRGFVVLHPSGLIEKRAIVP